MYSLWICQPIKEKLPPVLLKDALTRKNPLKVVRNE